MRLSGLLLLGVLVAACSTTAPPPPTPTVTSVTIDQGSGTAMLVGDSLALTATVEATGGAATTVSWSSSDATVATVDAATGAVNALKLGDTTITATSTEDRTKKDTITVLVDSPPANPNEIYVDASAASGGDGSSGAPYRLISTGVGLANVGATIHVLAGTYDEALTFTKAVILQGAGPGSTIITASSAASGSAVAMGVDGVDGLSLSGFTLAEQSPGAGLAALGVYRASTNFTLSNVTITQFSGSQEIGLELTGLATGTINNVTITDLGDSSGGEGVLIQNGGGASSSGIALANVTVNGHTGYAGIVLDPGSGTLTGISITGAVLNQIDKLQVNLGGGGSVTNLSAPQFTAVVRNTAPVYGSGQSLFYKLTEADALGDSLFNFGSLEPQSFVQLLPGADKSVLGQFVVGAADGGPYGYTGEVRVNSLQTAIDQAAAGATINVRSSSSETFDGALTIGKALTLSGAGGASKITAPAGSAVITVTADNVLLENLDINGNDNGSAALAFDAAAVPHLVVNNCNLTSALAVNDTATTTIGTPVDATTNWWGQNTGPVGGQVVSAHANVDTTPYRTTVVP